MKRSTTKVNNLESLPLHEANKNNKKKQVNIVGPMVLLCCFLLVWQILTNMYPPLVLPSPVKTLESLLKIVQSESFLLIIWTTVKSLIVGLTGAIITGSILGILMGANERMKCLFEPLVYFVQSTPPILYMSLAMIWFGLDGQATIFIVFIASIPVMAVNVYEGFENIDPKLLEMAKIFKFSKVKMITQIIIPSLKSYFKSGLIIVIGFAWKLVIMGEVLSSSTGLGSQITDARTNVQMDMVFAWGVVVILLCFLFQKSMAGLLSLKRIRRKNYDLNNE